MGIPEKLGPKGLCLGGSEVGKEGQGGKSTLRGNKLKVGEALGIRGLCYPSNSRGVDQGWVRGSGQKNLIHYHKKSPFTYPPFHLTAMQTSQGLRA